MHQARARSGSVKIFLFATNFLLFRSPDPKTENFRLAEPLGGPSRGSADGCRGYSVEQKASSTPQQDKGRRKRRVAGGRGENSCPQIVLQPLHAHCSVCSYTCALTRQMTRDEKDTGCGGQPASASGLRTHTHMCTWIRTCTHSVHTVGEANSFVQR